MAENGRRRDETAVISSLATGESKRKAARITGFSGTTIYRRLKNAGFFQRVIGQLVAINVAAVQRLDELVHSKDERVATQAIRMALEHTSKQRETVQEQADSRRLTESGGGTVSSPHTGDKLSQGAQS